MPETARCHPLCRIVSCTPREGPGDGHHAGFIDTHAEGLRDALRSRSRVRRRLLGLAARLVRGGGARVGPVPRWLYPQIAARRGVSPLCWWRQERLCGAGAGSPHPAPRQPSAQRSGCPGRGRGLREAPSGDRAAGSSQVPVFQPEWPGSSHRWKQEDHPEP